jgi:hypothetical protein
MSDPPCCFYEEELHIHIERGRVTGTRVYDNRGKEIDTYYPCTAAYERRIASGAAARVGLDLLYP